MKTEVIAFPAADSIILGRVSPSKNSKAIGISDAISVNSESFTTPIQCLRMNRIVFSPGCEFGRLFRLNIL